MMKRWSAETIGWCPCSLRSMMARRRCESATPHFDSTQTSASSGPRWRRRSPMSRAAPSIASRLICPAGLTNPAIPHMSVSVSALVQSRPGRVERSPLRFRDCEGAMAEQPVAKAGHNREGVEEKLQCLLTHAPHATDIMLEEAVMEERQADVATRPGLPSHSEPFHAVTEQWLLQTGEVAGPISAQEQADILRP